jgi:hypothetical protein
MSTNVHETIAEVEAILPGHAAADEEGLDPRWQAIISIADFIPAEPEAVWEFILRWGSHEDADLRTAVATVLLEHLLEHHFADFFSRVETAVAGSALFGDTFSRCSKFGQSKQEGNFERFDRLQQKCRIARKSR